MPSLITLPVELVVKILKGASLADILNVTHTSAFLRAVGCSSRSLWVNARDVDRLPLPMGETLHTVFPSAMGKLAARAIALSAAWSGPVARPLRVSHIGPCPSQPRSLQTLTSPHGTILPGNRWLLIDMDTDFPHVYCPENGEFVSLGVNGRVVSYAYESSNNGSEITLAVLKVTGRDSPHDHSRNRFIDVFVLQFDPKLHFRAVPCVRRAQSIRLPAAKCASDIDVKGSLVVVSANDELFIANWQECSGVNLSPPYGEDKIFSLKAYFHPDLSRLIAEGRMRQGYSIHVVSVPDELTPFEGSDLADESLRWPTESLHSTWIYTLPPQQAPQYRSFRRNGRDPPILDVISGTERGCPPDLSYLSFPHLEKLTPDTTCRKVQSRSHLFELRTTAGRTICLGRHRGYKERATHSLSFLRMLSRSREDPSWVSLEVPEDVTLKGIKSEVLAFDDIYGTLLLDDAVGNYCIVQY